jgi:hypothetical protein
MTAQHSFREVKWLQAPTLDASGSSVSPQAHLLLLDAGRNIAIYIPVMINERSAGTSDTVEALIGLRGLHGDFGQFHTGMWCVTSDESRE